jgi:hypothetical protein
MKNREYPYLGKFRRYSCACGVIRSVQIPMTKYGLRACKCGADIRTQPFVVDDVDVRRREGVEK